MQDIEELQRLLDAGGDITAKNLLGQTMHDVATEKECFSSLAWLEKVAAAAQKYLDDNEAIPSAIAENLGAVIKASSPSVRKSVRAVMAVGRLSRLSRLSTTALPGAK